MRKEGRIFFDLDGTLAEWRVLVVKSEEELYRILKQPGYYRNLAPYWKVVLAAKELIGEGYEVYSLSHYLDNCPAKEDKNAWVDQWIPEIPVERRIFVPYGEQKKNYVPGGIRKRDLLVDDFTKNLLEWPGAGVKLVNLVNDTRGTWQGLRAFHDTSPYCIKDVIKAAVR